MAQPSQDNRKNAAPRQGVRNSQTPPKSERRHRRKHYIRRAQNSTFGTPYEEEKSPST